MRRLILADNDRLVLLSQPPSSSRELLALNLSLPAYSCPRPPRTWKSNLRFGCSWNYWRFSDAVPKPNLDSS
jgi:hypothetical protein